VTTVAEPSPACAPADRAARHHVAGHDQRNTRRGLGCREVELADAEQEAEMAYERLNEAAIGCLGCRLSSASKR